VKGKQSTQLQTTNKQLQLLYASVLPMAELQRWIDGQAEGCRLC